jgi:glutamate carboxypeptidase
MRGLSSDEAAAVERAAGEPMLAQVEAWAAVNSGSRNLAGLARVAGRSPTPSPPCPAR